MARPKSTHCTDCGENLDLNPVYSSNGSRNWRKAQCRACSNERQRKVNLANPDRVRDTQLRYRLGTTLEKYNELLVAQNGACAICHQTCTSGKDLGTDHNHATGEIRGLLCHRCNRAIGLLKESPELISSAYEYLQRTTWSKGENLLWFHGKKESA